MADLDMERAKKLLESAEYLYQKGELENYDALIEERKELIEEKFNYLILKE